MIKSILLIIGWIIGGFVNYLITKDAETAIHYTWGGICGVFSYYIASGDWQ